MKVTEMTTQNDSRKSFYGKAFELDKGRGIFALRSYDTEVLTLNTKTNTLKLYGASIWSQTTLRHVREYLLQNDITPNNIMINGRTLNSFSKANLELLVNKKIKINQDNIIKSLLKKVS